MRESLVTIVAMGLALCAQPGRAQQVAPLPDGLHTRRPVATFSIVARDGKTGQLGVAVQSHWFSVGTSVPWAKAGVGAVATQSLVDVKYGPLGLALMAGGKSATQALQALTSTDPGQAYRQVAMVDANGDVATHTGSLCIAHAGDVAGELADGTVFSCQANMMARPGVPEAMARGFRAATGSLAERLVAALEAAQAAGGDVRGMQSAAILVVRSESTGRAWEDRLVELRVEDHPNPVAEIARLLRLHEAYEHMNAGDLAMEHGDVAGAVEHYGAAQRLAPDVAEMAFWTGVTLASAGRVDEALPHFRRAFADPTPGADWKALLRRLPASKLFPDDPALIERILREAGAAP